MIGQRQVYIKNAEYVFVTILNDMSKAWIVGRMEEELTMKKES